MSPRKPPKRRAPKTRKMQLISSHTRKRAYPTWARAFWELIKIKRLARETNYQGQPYWGHVYECTSTDTLSVTGPLHFHVGRMSHEQRTPQQKRTT